MGQALPPVETAAVAAAVEQLPQYTTAAAPLQDGTAAVGIERGMPVVAPFQDGTTAVEVVQWQLVRESHRDREEPRQRVLAEPPPSSYADVAPRDDGSPTPPPAEQGQVPQLVVLRR